MSAIGNMRSGCQRVSLPFWSAILGLAWPAVSLADNTNAVLPVVSVQAAANTAESTSVSGIFTVQRTGDTGQPLTVNYRVSGNATNGIDYRRLSGAVTIPAGQSAAQIEVTPIDHHQEGDSKNVTLTLVPQNQPFTLIALPDSQYYTREVGGGTRDIFTAQTRWIVDHKDALNIAFVLHEGDITDGNSASEWTNAGTSLGLLDGVVPYALAVGNHDGLMTSQSQTALFNQFFPVGRFQDLPTFGGVFESNRMDNCYHLFSAGGVDWLVFALEFGPRNEVLAWANQVAASHPNRRVMVVTHAHVYSDNTLHGSSPDQWWQPTVYGRPNNGTDVWDKFLRRQAGTALVFNGHVLNNGTGRLVGVNDYGNQVFQMLANYQLLASGGAGYLRIVQFFPDQDRMSVSTYSPYLDSWLVDSENQFAYTNLGFFTNASPGYQVEGRSAGASLLITNNNADLVPPGVSAICGQEMPPFITVTFTEPVEPASAQTLANYSLDPGVHLTGAALSSDGRTVVLTTDANPVGTTLYTLTVNHVKDRSRASNEMVLPAAKGFLYSPPLLSDDFTNGGLQGWTVLDEGTISGPSQWLEQSGRLMQLSNIYGPNAGATDHRQGTCLYWNDSLALGWSNYSFSVTFNNPDNDGVGVMFRYQNPSNYYKVDLDSQRNFHKLFKMAGGVETTLADETGGYVIGSNQVLHVEMTGSAITVWLNGTVLFSGPITDNSLKAGTVALYSWGSQGLCFNHLKVVPLYRSPYVTIQSPANGATFVPSDPVTITVDVFDPDGSIARVNLFGGTSLLAVLTNAPYTFQWTHLTPGNYLFTAQAVDDSGPIGVSSPVSFTVAALPSAPVLIEQPNDQNVCQGNGVVFRGRADGPPPFRYQWFFNGLPLGGATNTFLLLNNAQPADAGSYIVTVTNQWGAVASRPANLTVNSTAQPVNTNDPPALSFAGVEVLAPGVPLVSVNTTNVTTVRIDWSSNCLSWTPLLTLTNGGGRLYFADPDAAGQPRRFYRAVAQP